MKLSIVATLYNSTATVEPFCRRSLAAAEMIADDIEIILVDDGSPDNSLEIACKLADKDSRIVVVELSRNFGHHKAIMTGLDHATGDLIFLIDSDLEEDPALLDRFHKDLVEKQVDVVYGYQERRKGGWLERFSGDVAYGFFNLLIPHSIPRNHITVRLMRRPYVDALLQHRERETAIGGLWVITGFKQIGLPVEKQSRKGTSYKYWQRWRALIQSVASFSEVPLVAIFYLGVAISTLSVIVGLWLLSRKFFYNLVVAGWVSVMLSVWLLGGIMIFCIGIIGIYLSKVFIETKNRPYTIVRKVHRYDGKRD
jgi:putative glycosyltransferase